MIGLKSKVKIIDNSGGIYGQCIQVLSPKMNKSGKHIYLGKVGDVILITLTKVLAESKTKKGGLYKALIVRTKKESNIRKKRNFKVSLKNTEYLDSTNLNNKNYISSKISKFRTRFDDNAVVLIKLGQKDLNDFTPLGTRIKGPISKTLKYKKGCLKILSITTNNI